LSGCGNASHGRRGAQSSCCGWSTPGPPPLVVVTVLLLAPPMMERDICTGNNTRSGGTIGWKSAAAPAAAAPASRSEREALCGVATTTTAESPACKMILVRRSLDHVGSRGTHAAPAHSVATTAAVYSADGSAYTPTKGKGGLGGLDAVAVSVPPVVVASFWSSRPSWRARCFAYAHTALAGKLSP